MAQGIEWTDLLENVLLEASFEGLAVGSEDDVLELLPRKLQEGAIARDAKDFGHADEALPELVRGPDLLGDEAREEVGRDEGGERLVRLDRFDHLCDERRR